MRVPDAACLWANVQRHLRGDHEYVSGDVLHRRRMHDNARGVCILVSSMTKSRLYRYVTLMIYYVCQIRWSSYEILDIQTKIELSLRVAIAWRKIFLNCFSWLYTEHRKDRMLKEQKEPEAMMNHKNEDATDYNLKASTPRIDTQKNAQKTEMMNGIDNAAFESEQLWSHDLRDPFFFLIQSRTIHQ